MVCMAVRPLVLVALVHDVWIRNPAGGRAPLAALRSV